MKTKIATIAAALALTVSASAFAIPGTVGEGRVDFNGKVNGVSCLVTVNGDFKNTRVILDDVNVPDLQKATLVNVRPIDIAVTGCTGVALDNLSVKWTDGALASGINVGYLDNELKNGDAEGVYLALSTASDITGLVEVGNDAQRVADAVPFLDGKVFSYNVGYVLGNEVTTGNDVNPGRIASFATYQVDYK